MITQKQELILKQFEIRKKVIVKFNSIGIKAKLDEKLMETITSNPTSITIDSQSLL
jgi:hypothetical protein